MERSEKIQNLSKALAQFHALVGKISKDAKNPFFKSNYASLPHILTEIQEPLEKSGLVVSQFPDGDGLTTILIHAESGEYLQANYTLQAVRSNDPQAQGSAISYARRYAITSILNLAISDDDGEAATKPVRETQPEKPWLNPKTDNWDKVKKALQDGFTMDQIKAKYSISKANQEKLLSEI